MAEMLVQCAYCGAGLYAVEAWIGPNTGKPYCPDAMIRECLKTFGSKVEKIDCTYYPPPPGQPKLAGIAG